MAKKRDQVKIDEQVKDLERLMEETKTHSYRAAAIAATFSDERLRQYLSISH